MYLLLLNSFQTLFGNEFSSGDSETAADKNRYAVGSRSVVQRMIWGSLQYGVVAAGSESRGTLIDSIIVLSSETE